MPGGETDAAFRAVCYNGHVTERLLKSDGRRIAGMRKTIAAVLITAIMTGALCGCAGGQSAEPAGQAAEQGETAQKETAATAEDPASEPQEAEQVQDAGQEQEAAQAGETGPAEAAQTGETGPAEAVKEDGVRPLYRLHHHLLMQEQDLTLIASGSYDTVQLTEEAAIEYPHLNKAIEAENDLIREESEKAFAEIKGAAEDAVREQREDSEEFPSGEMEGTIVPVRCDDSVLSFYETTYMNYPGAAHGSMGFSGYNFETGSGEKITLSDVFKDPASLGPVVASNLRARADGSHVEDAEESLKYYFGEGMDYLAWVIDQDGVTFLFSPSDIAPYAMGILESRISFDRDPELFTGKFGPSGAGYARPMSTFTEMEADLDGDGSSEKLSVTGEYLEGDEINTYSGVRVSVGDKTCTAEQHCYGIDPCFVHTGDGKNYIYVVTGGDDDYPELLVFAIRDNVPELAGRMSGTGFAHAFYPVYEDGKYSADQSWYERSPLLDPSNFELSTRMTLMNINSGHRAYKAGEDGMPVPQTDYYEIDEGTTLTSLVPVAAEAVDPVTGEAAGEEKEIPAGTKLRFWRTNGTDTVDLRTDEDEAYRVKIEIADTQMIGGVKLEDAFEQTPVGE